MVMQPILWQVVDVSCVQVVRVEMNKGNLFVNY